MRWPSRPRRLRSGMNKFAATRVSSVCGRVAVSISKFGSRSYAPDSDQLSRAYRISTNYELRLRLSLCFQQSLALNGSEGEVMVNKVSASKFLSLLLRHKPEEVGLVLDPDGWAEIDQIVERTVIPPFLVLARSRGQAARANFCLGVMPPRAMFGRS